MLTERGWEPDVPLRLLVGLFVGMFVGSSVMVAWEAAGLKGAVDERWLSFVVASLSFHGVGAGMVWWLLRRQRMTASRGFGLREGAVGKVVLSGALIGLAVVPTAGLVRMLTIAAMESVGWTASEQMPVEMLREGPGIRHQVVMAFMAVCIAPVVEEVIFRGILYGGGSELGYPKVALWFSSVLFALCHANASTFVALLLFGLLLAWLYEATNNLLAPIAAHAAFNATNFVLLLIL